MSVLTVTLNPSIDRTIALSSLEVGEINRAAAITLHPGGKGINVSRAARAYGADTHALFIGGRLGESWMSGELDKAKIAHTVISFGDSIRSNMTIVESDGTVTKINEPGPTLGNSELELIKNSLSQHQLEGNWVVFAGRLNPGLSPDAYAELATFAKARGAKVAVDTSGEEFASAVKAGAVDLVKPNHHELSELVGRPLKTISDVIDAAHEVITGGVATILCSMGADGAILITEDGATHCEPIEKVSGTPVGAGDILLGIFIAAGCNVAALEAAIAWSAASVPLPGTSIPSSAQAEAVKVRTRDDFDRARVLVED
ncbi:MAG: 1-phosphofructokinase family hexose kinase [Candidatus Planktophila sp.]